MINLAFFTFGIGMGLIGIWGIISTLRKPPRHSSAEIAHYKQILELLFTIKTENRIMNAETKALLDELKAEAAEQTTVVGSVVTLFGTLTTKIDDLLNKPDEELRAGLTEVRDAFDQGNKALAEAVTKNTPAEGQPGEETGGDEGNGEGENENEG
jgi:hypothetical protein